MDDAGGERGGGGLWAGAAGVGTGYPESVLPMMPELLIPVGLAAGTFIATVLRRLAAYTRQRADAETSYLGSAEADRNFHEALRGRMTQEAREKVLRDLRAASDRMDAARVRGGGGGLRVVDLSASTAAGLVATGLRTPKLSGFDENDVDVVEGHGPDQATL